MPVKDLSLVFGRFHPAWRAHCCCNRLAAAA